MEGADLREAIQTPAILNRAKVQQNSGEWSYLLREKPPTVKHHFIAKSVKEYIILRQFVGNT
jgi:hypothetical protein